LKNLRCVCKTAIPRAKLLQHAEQGSGRENSMHRYCKVLLGSAAAVALVSGAVMLTTSEASAQINIEGLIRGAMSHGYGGYSRHHRGKVKESKHERRSKDKDDADDDDSSKGKKEESADTDGKGSSAQTQVDSSAKKLEPVPAANTSPPKQPVADVPSLTPER
jgi:uncharacterized sporulation protein YeaH/YhbH (DUF444 family)